MSASAKLLQIILILFNVAFLALGIVIVVSGAYYLDNTDQAQDPGGAHNTGLSLVVMGAVTILVGLMGCCGAFCRSRGLLIVYSVLLTALVVAQCVFGGMAISNSNNGDTVDQYARSYWSGAPLQTRIDYQQNNKCCGYNFPSPDFIQTKYDLLGAGPCGPLLRKQFSTMLLDGGVYLFVAAACEVLAIIISMVLIFDQSRRDSGFHRKQQLF